MARFIIIIEDLSEITGKSGVRITGATQDHEKGDAPTRAMSLGRGMLEAVQASLAGRGSEQVQRPIDDAAVQRTQSIVDKAIENINGPTPPRPKVRAPMRRAPKGHRP